MGKEIFQKMEFNPTNNYAQESITRPFALKLPISKSSLTQKNALYISVKNAAKASFGGNVASHSFS